MRAAHDITLTIYVLHGTAPCCYSRSEHLQLPTNHVSTNQPLVNPASLVVATAPSFRASIQERPVRPRRWYAIVASMDLSNAGSTKKCTILPRAQCLIDAANQSHVPWHADRADVACACLCCRRCSIVVASQWW